MKKKKIISAVLILTSLLLLLSSSLVSAELTPPLPGGSNYIDKDVEEVHEMLDENSEQIILLDVRTEAECSAECISGAINIPVSDLENRIGELDMSKVIVYCQSGGRSKTASGILAQHGFFVYNMLGGINMWKKEKFATSTATPMPSQTPVATHSPTVTPSPTSPTPAASPFPITSPITTPGVPGFEVTFAIAAISMIAWCMLRKRRKA